MHEMIVAFTAVGGTMFFFILWIYLFFSSRHKERMKLIETGQSANIFSQSHGKTSLKLSLFLIGAGVGIFAAMLLIAIGLPEEPSVFSMILICSGIGLFTAHKMAMKEAAKERAERSYASNAALENL